MNKILPLSVAQIRKSEGASAPLMLEGDIDHVVKVLRPAMPLYVIRPEMIAARAQAFMKAFPGQAMFAVKTNPDKAILRIMYRAGMKAFDAASIEEVRLVKKAAPKAAIYFMHPVKAPEAIHEAYHKHGVRAFVLDHMDELHKIMRETNLAADLTLFVRLALPKNDSAGIDFSSKFGALPDEAAELLRACRAVAPKIGLAFHVGTQSLDATVYGRAVKIAADTIRASGVTVDVLDCGGGYAVDYVGETAPETQSCFDSLTAALETEGLDCMELLAEPGRVLVAEAGSLVVRVEARRGDMLHINDGTYGGLFDAGPLLNVRFPVKAVRPSVAFKGEQAAFRMTGPTCDSLDMMNGPFMLPDDIEAGDWIEIGNTGAYSVALRSNFNGFGKANQVFLIER